MISMFSYFYGQDAPVPPNGVPGGKSLNFAKSSPHTQSSTELK